MPQLLEKEVTQEMGEEEISVKSGVNGPSPSLSLPPQYLPQRKEREREESLPDNADDSVQH